MKEKAGKKSVCTQFVLLAIPVEMKSLLSLPCE